MAIKTAAKGMPIRSTPTMTQFTRYPPHGHDEPSRRQQEHLEQEQQKQGQLNHPYQHRYERQACQRSAGVVSAGLLLCCLIVIPKSEGFSTTPWSTQSRPWSPPATASTGSTLERMRATTVLFGKRNKNKQAREDMNDANRWYDAVKSDATPDDVFWEEMERQRMLNKIGAQRNNEFVPEGSSSSTSGSSQQQPKVAVASMASSVAAFQNNIKPSAAVEKQYNKQMADRSIEATLTEYARFQVRDNWLDPELQERFLSFGDEEEEEGDDEEEGGNGAVVANRRNAKKTQESDSTTLTDADFDEMVDKDLNDMVDELSEEEEEEEDGDDESTEQTVETKASKDSSSSKDLNAAKGLNDLLAFQADAEPWDVWSLPPEVRRDRTLRIAPNPESKYLYTEEVDNDKAEFEQMEREFEERLSQLRIQSRRLEKARDNPNARSFFQQEPDAVQGYDQMWASAVDNLSFNNLKGTFRPYGVQFADNFGDWEEEEYTNDDFTIEEIASYKARQVYKVTGLPSVASRTSFEIEPVVPASQQQAQPGSPRPNANPAIVSPRVAMGYKFNDLGAHVDYMVEALKGVSEPNRVTRFTTCMCYYDGEIEMYDYGTLDCDIYFCNSMRAYIPIAAAITEMCKKLQLTLGLEFQKWLKYPADDQSTTMTSAMVSLRDRVLKDGKVLPNDIIDVSAFMDSMVDVNLMDDCARALSNHFVDSRPTKILTVATTGLVIALPMAKYLQVPVVYARKERNVVMADTYKAAYSSKTVGKNRELLVSKSHLDEDDRVLIVDDFLSGGSSQVALLRIVNEAGATAVGVGVLLEKVYDSGRLALSGFDVPVHSLCTVVSVKDGVIQLQEEDGFSAANASSRGEMA